MSRGKPRGGVSPTSREGRAPSPGEERRGRGRRRARYETGGGRGRRGAGVLFGTARGVPKVDPVPASSSGRSWVFLVGRAEPPRSGVRQNLASVRPSAAAAASPERTPWDHTKHGTERTTHGAALCGRAPFAEFSGAHFLLCLCLQVSFVVSTMPDSSLRLKDSVALQSHPRLLTQV